MLDKKALLLSFTVLSLVSATVLSGCSKSITEKDRVLARTHYDIAINRFQNGQIREALRELLRVVKHNPGLARAQNALGMVYHALGQLEDSLKHYQKAVVLEPQFSEAHNNLGALLIDLGRFDEAIDEFRVSLNDILYQTPSLAEGNMGWAYYRKGEIDQGIRHIRNAVATNPHFCRGYEWLSRIGLDQENSEDVATSYRRYLKHCSGNDAISLLLSSDHVNQMHYYFGVSLLKQGARDQARKILSLCADPQAEKGFASKCTTSLESLN